MPDEIKAPDKGTTTQDQAETKVEAEVKIPEKFQGKSTEEVVKAYEELSKTIGKQGEELGRTKKETEEFKKQIDNWKALGQVIESDPALFKLVESKINPTKESNGEAPDEVKTTISQNVVKEFEDKYGINKLDADRAQALRVKIGQEIESVAGIKVADIPLSKLGAILEKGYTLATVGDKEEQARRQGYLEARENREAEFGSIQSSGVNSQTKQLTPDEQKVARRLNISDEDYAKYKDKN